MLPNPTLSTHSSDGNHVLINARIKAHWQEKINQPALGRVPYFRVMRYRSRIANKAPSFGPKYVAHSP
jgi:hypothetical protein